MKSSKSRTLGIWMILIGIVVLAIYSQKDEELDSDEIFSHYEKVGWSQFTDDLEAKRITQLIVYSDVGVLLAFTNDQEYYRTDDLLDTLSDSQQELLDEVVEVTELSASEMSGEYSGSGGLGDLLKYLVIFGLLVFALIFFLKKFGGRGMDNILSLRHSKARFFTDYQTVKFSDVGGCEEAKEALADVVDFLNNPDRWVNAGARLPRGILLEGPPGCGKTLLARAVAGESSAKFFLVSASEFVEMFVGVGAARVRDMFEQAAKEAPAIIFIDELDAIGRKRGTGIGSAHDEREQTLNQILVSLDGFEPTDRIVVLAATNRADILDAALVRPGRFDQRLVISVPGKKDRENILKIHLAKLKLNENVSVEQLASLTDGMTGAQLENLVNDAVMLAVRRVRQENSESVVVGMADFEGVIHQKKQADRSYNLLDSVLIESASQFAAPTGRAVVRLTLKSEEILEGEVIWMDSAMIKVIGEDGREVIVAKNQITRLEPLAGTESIDAATVNADQWTQKSPDLAG